MTEAQTKFGFIVVILGLVSVLIIYLIAVFKLPASDLATALGSLGGVIGSIVGAFFGLQIGANGKKQADQQRDKAEQQRKKAEDKALALAGLIPPVEFKAFRDSRSDLFRD